jgi:hypothetical protein
MVLIISWDSNPRPLHTRCSSPNLGYDGPHDGPDAGEVLVAEVAEDLPEGVRIAEVRGVVVPDSVHPHRAAALRARAQQVCTPKR